MPLWVYNALFATDLPLWALLRLAIDPATAIDPAATTAPVLIVHARDDRLTPFSTASFTAARIDGAEVLTIDSGGHLLLGHHNAIRTRIAIFLATHAQPAIE